MDFGSISEMLVALAQIIVINIVLSGDNAVVLALACRTLPPRQQKQALLLGSVGVVVLMVLLTSFASYLLSLPYLQLVGAGLLLWIGIKLLLPEEGDSDVKQSDRLFEAVKTIIIADIVMSLDNVLGLAGATKGHLGMLVVGLVITIPLVLFGSALIVKLMDRLPVLVPLGAGLLGYVAGEMAVDDPVVAHWIEARASSFDIVLPIVGHESSPGLAVPIIGAIAVIAAGKLLARRAADRPLKDLANDAAGKSANPGD